MRILLALAAILAVGGTAKAAENLDHCLAARDAAKAGKLAAEKSAEYREKFANPWIAAERGYIDEVIEPARTRPKLIAALRVLDNKKDTMPYKKHGNIPL